MKKWILLFALISSGSGAFIFSSTGPLVKKPQLTVGLPWNGGKQHGPFEIHSSVKVGETVEADRDLDVDLSLIFNGPCERASLQVRGLDGVELVGGVRFDFDSCGPDENLTQTIRVRLPAGTHGRLAVDVSYINQGHPWNETRSIELTDQQGLNEFSMNLNRKAVPAGLKHQNTLKMEKNQHANLVRIHQADTIIR